MTRPLTRHDYSIETNRGVTVMTNHATKFVQHLGKSFMVIAEFPDTEAGVQASNKFMTRHPKASVLLTQDGSILLSHCDDKGAGTGPATVSAKAKRAIANYGAGVCLAAYRMTEPGDGARTIADSFNITTNQADAAIDAGRELAGDA
nr:hypothetical protein [Pseudomonas fluorescens]